MNAVLHKFWLRLPAILLLAVTIGFWGCYDRYESAGPMLVENPAIGDASQVRGDCAQTNGVFVLRVPEGGGMASIAYRLPDIGRYGFIRVKGRIRTDRVVAGKYSWRCARIIMVQYKNGKWIPGDHGLVMISGTTDWQFREDVFEVVPDAEYGMFQIQQAGEAGTAWFDQLSVEPVQVKASYAWWRALFTLAWLSLVPLYFKRCRLHRRKLKVLILFNAIAILIGTTMPSDWIEDVAQETKVMYQDVKKEASSHSAPTATDKNHPRPTAANKTDAASTAKLDEFNQLVGNAHGAGHFVLFGSLCFLVFLSAALEHQHGIFFVKAAFDILLFAAATESLQYLTLDRTPGVHDWLIDLYGMLAALLVFMVLYPWIRLSQKRKV